MKDGYGTLIFANCEKYIGEFRNNNFHGYGTYYFINGDKYEGHWERGLRHGNAKETVSGTERESIWANGIRSQWLDEQNDAVTQRLIQILRLSNEPIGACSICCDNYSPQNPVLVYSTCNHCICRKCYNIADNRSRCQINASCAGGSYSESMELTQAAMEGIRLPTEELITFSVMIERQATQYQFSMNPRSTTLGQLQQELQRLNLDVVSIAVEGNVYRIDSNQSKTLYNLEVRRMMTLRAIVRYQGCPNA